MATGKVPCLYPLRFKEILRGYSFGERWITEEFSKPGLPEGERIAETWEVCDRPAESSGIVNGPLQGWTLRQAMDTYGEELLGRDMVRRFGLRFPLLIKLLDASNTLIEQVHPNDELTRAWGLNDYSGKTEAWYMLRTRPGARVFCGNVDGVSRERLREALQRGDAPSVMAEHIPRPGDAFLLYAGTMHYSPGGVLFYEIMQNSDVVLGLRRRDDAGAPGRGEWLSRALAAVHLEDGFDCRARPVTLYEGRNRRTFVMACREFAVERLDLTEPWPAAPGGERFWVLTLIKGQAGFEHAGGRERLLPGNSCLAPAGLAGAVVRPSAEATVLKGYVPDLLRDVVEPLRAAGASAEDIRSLGGRTRLNPLNELV